MQSAYFDNMNRLGVRVYETSRQLGELNIRVGGKLVERQVDLVDFYLHTSIAQLKRVGEVRTLQNVVEAQTDLAKLVVQRLLTEAKSVAGLTVQTHEQVAGVLQDGAVTSERAA